MPETRMRTRRSAFHDLEDLLLCQPVELTEVHGPVNDFREFLTSEAGHGIESWIIADIGCDVEA